MNGTDALAWWFAGNVNACILLAMVYLFIHTERR